MLDSALGKVLFIDEAYSLQNGSFGKEAVDEIVRCLTHEKYQGRMAVILAGYERDIDQLMQANEGLRSRFDQMIKFSPFNVAACCWIQPQRLH